MIGSTLKKKKVSALKVSEMKTQHFHQASRFNMNEEPSLRSIPKLDRSTPAHATETEMRESSKRKRQNMLLKRPKSQSPRVNLTDLENATDHTCTEVLSQRSKNSGQGVPSRTGLQTKQTAPDLRRGA